ncbi:hypothetical protein TDB9533_02685 [Thalassocella blandensis]|nr:hypothetical protein TDB9533_02685 [Thalassocella blandensis]
MFAESKLKLQHFALSYGLSWILSANVWRRTHAPLKRIFPLVVHLALLLFVLPSPQAFSAAPERFIVTITSKLDQGDTRHNFERELVVMLLKKTESEYGTFEILDAPPMSYSRALLSLKENTYPNFIRGFVYDTYNTKEFDLGYIPFPILRGLLGYRTCFISSKIKSQFAKVTTREELITYSHGYGPQWADIKIMRNAGIEVFEVPKYKSLFNMVAENRFDLFCRGTNEIYDEYQRNQSIPNFDYDTSKAFFYHFPFFFHSHKSNTLILERLTRGLQMAWEDGSFEGLWWKHHKRNLNFVKLKERKIFYFDNPTTHSLDKTFEKYLYQIE